MQALLGASALSAFKQANLQDSLRADFPNLESVSARFIHFLDLQEEFSDAEQQVMESLLCYGENSIDTADQAQSIQRIVVPRLGTISPWSSKATDIVHNCGLQT